MLYYIFKVQDNLGQDYYILNNIYIGYVGFDSQYIRSLLEHRRFSGKKGEGFVSSGYGETRRLKQKYQLIAQAFFEDYTKAERKLHKWNCASERFAQKEIDFLIKICKFKRSRDKTWYKVYYPNKNSSESILREIPSQRKSAKLKIIK